MNLKIVLFIIALVALGPASGSFWDSVPLVSQAKSLVQVVSGDPDGAKTTQVNFINQAPVVSQVKSIVHVAQGDHDEAKRTQEQFLHEFIEPMADNTPVVGHIKGAIHIAAGDKERGEQILKGASTSTAAVVGALVAGPAGAIGAAAAADGVITGIDSAVKEEYTPFGIVDYFSRLDEHSPGEHFDTLFGVGVEFTGGRAAKKGPANVKPVAKAVYDSALELKKKTRNDETLPLLQSEPPNLSTLRRRARPSEDPPVGKTVYGSGRAPVNQPFRELDNILEQEFPSPFSWRTLNDVPLSKRNYKNPIVLKLAREKSGLKQVYAEQLDPIDFREVNDAGGVKNCYYCCLAAWLNKKVSDVIGQLETMGEADGAPNVKYIVDLYKRAGFKDVKNLFSGAYVEFESFLDNNIPNGHSVRFTMPYRLSDESGHVVNAKAWKTLDGRLRLVSTDFQKAPFEGHRFAIGFPNDVKTVHMIFDEKFNELGHSSE